MARLTAGWMVFVGGFVSAFFALAAYRYRAGQADCIDAVAERYREPVANTADGGWTWFPTGLACTFTLDDGSLGAITPSPVFSIVFWGAVATLLCGVILLAVIPRHVEVASGRGDRD